MLRELCACHCNLSDESIPDLSFLSSLEILRLSGNNFRWQSILKRLKSYDFSGLSKLKALELNNCNLNYESIPNNLSYFPSLEEISLR